MEEYKFEVAYVVPAGTSDAEKEKAKQEDLSILKAEYEAEAKKEVKASPSTRIRFSL